MRELPGRPGCLDVTSIQIYPVSRLVVWSRGSILVIVLDHVIFGLNQCCFGLIQGFSHLFHEFINGFCYDFPFPFHFTLLLDPHSIPFHLDHTSLPFPCHLSTRLSLFPLSMTHKPQGLLPLLFPHCLTLPGTHTDSPVFHSPPHCPLDSGRLQRTLANIRWMFGGQ